MHRGKAHQHGVDACSSKTAHRAPLQAAPFRVHGMYCGTPIMAHRAPPHVSPYRGHGMRCGMRTTGSTAYEIRELF